MKPDFHGQIPAPSALDMEVRADGGSAKDPGPREMHPRADEFWAKSGVPLRHKSTKVDFTNHPAWTDSMMRLRQVFNTASGSIVVLLGGRGAGKTQAAVELLRVSVRMGCSCRYATAMDFFGEIKRTFSSESTDNEVRVIHEYTTPAVLCLDELQVRTESPWENNVLTHMIDKRYQFRRATMLIANIVPEDLRECVGDSIYSRTMETGGVVLFSGPSFRSCRLVTA